MPTVKFDKEALYNKLLEKINKDSHLQKTIISKNISKEVLIKNIFLIERYFDRKQVCKKCKSLESCLQENAPGFVYEIDFFDETANINLKICDKKKKILVTNEKLNAVGKNFWIRDFPEEDLLLKFSSIEIKKQKPEFVQFLSNMLKIKITKGNMFSVLNSERFEFAQNIFKSLANAISIKKNASVCFIDLPNTVINYENMKKNDASNFMNYNKKETNELEKFTNQLKTVNYLFINNIGAERLKDVFHFEFLTNILSERINNSLPTFFLVLGSFDKLYENSVSRNSVQKLQFLKFKIKESINKNNFNFN